MAIEVRACGKSISVVGHTRSVDNVHPRPLLPLQWNILRYRIAIRIHEERPNHMDPVARVIVRIAEIPADVVERWGLSTAFGLVQNSYVGLEICGLSVEVQSHAGTGSFRASAT